MNNFIYEIPTKIYFGENQIQKNLRFDVGFILGNKWFCKNG